MKVCTRLVCVCKLVHLRELWSTCASTRTCVPTCAHGRPEGSRWAFSRAWHRPACPPPQRGRRARSTQQTVPFLLANSTRSGDQLTHVWRQGGRLNSVLLPLSEHSGIPGLPPQFLPPSSFPSSPPSPLPPKQASQGLAVRVRGRVPSNTGPPAPQLVPPAGLASSWAEIRRLRPPLVQPPAAPPPASPPPRTERFRQSPRTVSCSARLPLTPILASQSKSHAFQTLFFAVAAAVDSVLSTCCSGCPARHRAGVHTTRTSCRCWRSTIPESRPGGLSPWVQAARGLRSSGRFPQQAPNKAKCL